MNYTLGIDISDAQGSVDHDKVADYGMKFCIVKATEGRTFQAKRFEENIRKIRDVASSGKVYLPGAYHFARPDTDGGNAQDGRAEANNFCDTVLRVCGSVEKDFMPPALDFEKYSESDQRQNIPWIQAFLETCEDRLNRRPMIYTGANIWRYEVGNTDLFKDYALWQVYYSGSANQPPQMPWDRWTLWQYSGGGSYQNHEAVPGVGVVDVNRFAGGIDELMLFANAGSPTPEVPVSAAMPPPPMVFDIGEGSKASEKYVARVQALLIAHGYGTQGLVSSNGRPDGIAGATTRACLVDFKSNHGLAPTTLVDWQTWWALTCSDL